MEIKYGIRNECKDILMYRWITTHGRSQRRQRGNKIGQIFKEKDGQHENEGQLTKNNSKIQ
jgi:hypothetical protein